MLSILTVYRIFYTGSTGHVRNHNFDSRLPSIHKGKLVRCVVCLVLSVSKHQSTKPTSSGTDKTFRDIGLVLAAYTIWKLLKGTKIIALADIPLVEALERAAQDQEEVKKVPKWRQVAGFLWD